MLSRFNLCGLLFHSPSITRLHYHRRLHVGRPNGDITLSPAWQLVSIKLPWNNRRIRARPLYITSARELCPLKKVALRPLISPQIIYGFTRLQVTQQFPKSLSEGDYENGGLLQVRSDKVSRRRGPVFPLRATPAYTSRMHTRNRTHIWVAIILAERARSIRCLSSGDPACLFRRAVYYRPRAYARDGWDFR